MYKIVDLFQEKSNHTSIKKNVAFENEYAAILNKNNAQYTMYIDFQNISDDHLFKNVLNRSTHVLIRYTKNHGYGGNNSSYTKLAFCLYTTGAYCIVHF